MPFDRFGSYDCQTTALTRAPEYRQFCTAAVPAAAAKPGARRGRRGFPSTCRPRWFTSRRGPHPNVSSRNAKALRRVRTWGVWAAPYAVIVLSHFCGSASPTGRFAFPLPSGSRGPISERYSSPSGVTSNATSPESSRSTDKCPSRTAAKATNAVLVCFAHSRTVFN